MFEQLMQAVFNWQATSLDWGLVLVTFLVIQVIALYAVNNRR